MKVVLYFTLGIPLEFFSFPFSPVRLFLTGRVWGIFIYISSKLADFLRLQATVRAWGTLRCSALSQYLGRFSAGLPRKLIIYCKNDRLHFLSHPASLCFTAALTKNFSPYYKTDSRQTLNIIQSLSNGPHSYSKWTISHDKFVSTFAMHALNFCFFLEEHLPFLCNAPADYSAVQDNLISNRHRFFGRVGPFGCV